MMKETLQILIESIVDDSKSVKITENVKDNIVSYEVSVSDRDIGKVIGKEGKMAKAIRTIMKSIATKNKVKVTIEFAGK
mgnify:CR=1 FL=1